jgi:hypothetical protein
MIGRWTRRLVLIAFLLACGASCSQAGGGAPTCCTKIDDMERDGGYTIEWPPPSGLAAGVWFSSTDCSQAGKISPPPAVVTDGGIIPSAWSPSALPTSHETFPGIISTHAAHLYTTSQLDDGWGANISLSFAVTPGLNLEIVPTGGSDAGAQQVDASAAGQTACPTVVGAEAGVDLSAYSGITFWAKGDPTGARTLQVGFLDSNTDPRGGICNYTDSNSRASCYNAFSKNVALTETFAQYTVDFASLQQDPAWGYRPDSGIVDRQHVYGLAFQVNAPFCYTNEMCVGDGGSPPAYTFDIWIDDLYFVNK